MAYHASSAFSQLAQPYEGLRLLLLEAYFPSRASQQSSQSSTHLHWELGLQYASTHDVPIVYLPQRAERSRKCLVLIPEA